MLRLPTALLFLLFLLHPFSAGAVGSCTDLFAVSDARPALEPALTIDRRIPARTRDIIVQSFAKIRALSEGLKSPATPPEIVLSDRDGMAGGGALPVENRIEIKASALALSDRAFETFITHEFTHFVVARNFRAKIGNGDQSLLELLQEARVDTTGKFDPFTLMAIAAEHSPYAELLCDVAAIISSRNPHALPEMITELHRITDKHPDERKAIEASTNDLPKELSMRDFTISYLDPRWAAYQPRESTYNRFNQIRAYLWQRWIRTLPPDQGPRFFGNLVREVESLYFSGQLDFLATSEGTAKANSVLIDYLEKRLQP